MTPFYRPGVLLPLVCLVILAATLMVTAATGATPSNAENPPRKHRIVFELTTEGAEQWTAILNNVENLREALGAADTQIEVVAHGKGLGIMLATNESASERMKKLADAGVVFAACENTMKRQKVSKDQLLPFVVTVDSGVAEIVRKQELGWSYIKSGT